ncbi:MAG: Ribosomal RNA small subunit methyltransferase A [bacterium ADurb.Bin400]|nr:MAG: Ribosomal RNA small subunit methyltransferase A [bacterium ADurb.Bin400]
MNLANRHELISYLQKHGLYTKRQLGQNFLVDRAALASIVGAADIRDEDCVVEVGPGLGVMTEELVRRAGKVVAVEIDQVLAALLAERMKKEFPGFVQNLEIAVGSILSVNLPELLQGCSSYKVVANIPYYITSKILELFLNMEQRPDSIVVLTQKEVAERICARPGEMSVLAVSVQLFGEPEIVRVVPARSFFPAPEVDSAVLRIKNIKEPEWNGLGEQEFFRCVKHGFAARRKTLLNNLSAGYHLEKGAVLDILGRVGLASTTRAQEVSIEQWKELCRQFK